MTVRSGELLLRWVSGFTEIRVARLQAAAERLCAPPVPMTRNDPRMRRHIREAKRLTRNLLRLGHVEEWTKERYRTVPPTLLAIESGNYVLVGARSKSLLQKLKNWRGIVAAQRLIHEEAPAAHYFAGKHTDVISACKQLKIHLCKECWGDVIASLPDLQSTLATALECSVPDGIERWNPHAPWKQRWVHDSNPSKPGLYRTIHTPHQWYFRPESGRSTLRLDTLERRDAVVWLLLRHHAHLKYDTRSGKLAIPATGFWLPLLIDRGLILASGRLPERHDGHWNYTAIDLERARHTARILGVKWEVTT